MTTEQNYTEILKKNWANILEIEDLVSQVSNTVESFKNTCSEADEKH